ncbi:ABC transporter substrate-binding protein [Streptosporangium sp. NBC_01755]|uniref:ABC transporter substrate-binding protein n=1 Tax=Streptosporangium sp. NBC_01755 TaxID=2975949 RepID=UPI002DD97ADF|nr:ABC transporter substrate-binding protein [Streptosporangium sp. NBC_01755]WSC97319.1 ABC transporter substrate-binding protein [Streptosporangium sp. NBC_01755]
MKPKILVTAVVTASALLLSSCGGDAESGSSDSADSTFKVLVVASQTGPLAALGKPFLIGLQVAADELNKAGGILGQQVELKVLDSQSDPTKAVSLLQQELASGDQPDLVWDGTISAETLALLPVLSQRKILSIGATGNEAINDPEKYPYTFHSSAHQATDGMPANVAAMQELGCKSVGLLAPNDASGEPVRDNYPAGFESAGLPLTVEEYATGDIDMTAPLARLESAGVDCVVAFAAGPAAPYVIKSRAKSGWDAPLMLNEAITTDVYNLVSPEELEGVSIHTYAINAYREPAARTPAYTSLQAGLKAKGNMEAVLLNYAWPHDLLQLVAMGVRQAGSTDPDQVKQALENLEQPAEQDRPYVAYTTMAWSATDHFIDAGENDYAVVKSVTPLEDGTWK